MLSAILIDVDRMVGRLLMGFDLLSCHNQCAGVSGDCQQSMLRETLQHCNGALKACLETRQGAGNHISLRQLIEQRLCFVEIGGVEALGEPAVDRREKVAGFGVAALVAAQPGEACGGAQFPELGPLLLGDA
jgi:hypothetical protein